MNDLTKYERFAGMNLDELKEQAEALNIPATAFDILTLHKAIKHLEEKLTEINDSMYITIKNGSDKKAKLSDVVCEIYEAQKSYRIRRIIASYLKENKTFLTIILLLISFIGGALFGIKIDIIKVIQQLIFN